MKLHLRFDNSDGTHARSTIFVNGKNAGNICSSPAEMIWLHNILEKGCNGLSPPRRTPIEFRASGICPNATHEEIDAAVQT